MAVSVVKATIAQCPLSVGLLLFLFTCQRPFPVVTWLSGSRPDFPLPASKRRSRQYGDRPLRTKEVNSTQMAAGAGSTQKWRLVTRLLTLLGLPRIGHPQAARAGAATATRPKSAMTAEGRDRARAASVRRASAPWPGSGIRPDRFGRRARTLSQIGYALHTF